MRTTITFRTGEHEHEHGSGIFGWFREMFGHSHSAVGKVGATKESTERDIWAPKISLVALGITATLQLVIVLVAGSGNGKIAD